jgi:hypothetical protein
MKLFGDSMRAAGAAILLGLVAGEPACAARATPTGETAAAGDVLRQRASLLGVERHALELATGHSAAWPLEIDDSSELGAGGVVMVDAPPEDVLARVHDLTLLRDRGVLIASGRVAGSADGSAFEGLELPTSSADAIGSARPGASDIKLSEGEIRLLSPAGPERREVLFRQVLASRLAAWRERGIAGLGTYADKRRSLDQSKATAALLENLSCTRPACGLERTDAFAYWSVERLGSLKPVVTVTDMATYEAAGLVRVETVQIYATHYFDGLVTAIDLVPLPIGERGSTLVRVSVIARLDLFTGILGAIKLRSARSKMVDGLAECLERARATFSRGGTGPTYAAGRT